MTDTDQKIDAHFFTLVTSLQAAAWQQMGKIASPFSGKVERNLDQARTSIDMLGMLSEKTKGNLSDEEDKLITQVLYDLKINYVEESKKPEPETEKKEEGQPASKEPETEKKEEDQLASKEPEVEPDDESKKDHGEET